MVVIKSAWIGDVTILTIRGKLLSDKESKRVHEEVKALLEKGTGKLVIDLSHIKWINSQGLGMLMACLSTVRKKGGVMKVAGSQEKVKNILVVTKLVTLFKNFDTVDEAVASFRSNGLS